MSQHFPEQIELIESDFLNSDYDDPEDCPLYRALFRYGIRDFQIASYGVVLDLDYQLLAKYDWDYLKYEKAKKSRVFPVIVKLQK